MTGTALLDVLALIYFLGAWFIYHYAVEHTALGATSLNALMNKKRLSWLMQALERENRIVDTQVLNGLQNGTAFFASTSLIALGGAVTLLRSSDELLRVFADLPFNLPSTRGTVEIKIIGLAILFAYAFFKFSWSYRIFNYAAILLGSMSPAARKGEPAVQAEAIAAARMNTVAGRHFNHGQRAFFFAVAYLGWFAGPFVFIAATSAVLIVMWARQFRSDARQALL